MTYKLYTGTLTDCHGNRWMPFYLLTAKELEGMTKAGVLPDDIREVVGLEDAVNDVIAAAYAKHAIERVKAGVTA